MGPTGRDATLSPCGLYRYVLSRSWGDGGPLVFVMLNPSTADAVADDPTVRKCVGYAGRAGYGGLVVVNLFAFRATEPADLLESLDPVGPDNDHWISSQVAGRDVVCAWGVTPYKSRRVTVRERPHVVLGMLRRHAGSINRLRLTNEQRPSHPLYLPADLKPVAWGTQPDRAVSAADLIVLKNEPAVADAVKPHGSGRSA